MKGIVRLVKTHTDPVTGETSVTEDRTVSNSLAIQYFENYMDRTNIQRGQDWDIELSEYPFAGAGAELDNKAITGTRNNYTYTPHSSSSPGIHQWIYTFNPPASVDRVIRSISLEDFTILELWDSPCIQTTTETLTVYYNLINELAVPADYPNLTPSQLDRFQQMYWLDNNTLDTLVRSGKARASISNFPAELINDINFAEALGVNFRPHAELDSIIPWDNSQSPNFVSAAEEGYVRFFTNDYNTATASTGRLLSSVTFRFASSSNNTWLSYIAPAQNLLPAGASKVQNTFSRNSIDPGFQFENTGTSATGTGTVVIDDNDTWTGPDGFATKYKIEIVTGGNVALNEVTYRLRRQYYTGDHGANGGAAPVVVVNQPRRDQNGAEFPLSADLDFSRQHGVPTWHVESLGRDTRIETAPNVIKFKIPDFVSWDKTGITFNSIAGKQQVHLDASSVPALPVTNIMQIAIYEDYDIIVACRNTGLWRVVWDETTRTVSSVTSINGTSSIAIDNTKCWGVQIKSVDQSLWALYSNSANDSYVLVRSLDKGATWVGYDSTTATQFAIPGLTDSAASQHPTSLHIDPIHPDDRFLISYNSAADGAISTDTAGTYSWWSRANSSPTSDAVGGTLSNSYIGTKFKSTSAIACTRSGIWLSLRHNTGFSTQWYTLHATRFGENFTTTSQGSVKLGTPAIPLAYENEEEIYVNPGSSQIVKTSDWATTIVSPITSSILFTPSISPSLLSSAGAIFSSATINAITDGNTYPVTHLGSNLFLFAADEFSASNSTYRDMAAYSVFVAAYTGHSSFSTINYGLSEVFGWDGTKWVKGDASPKIASFSREPILDGLAVTFGGTGVFVAGESYDTYLYNGIVKDNATAISNLRGNLLQAFPKVAQASTGVIPAPSNATVTEPLYGLFDTASSNSSPVMTYRRNGYHWKKGRNRTNYTANLVFEHTLTGDFTLKLRPANYYHLSTSTPGTSNGFFALINSATPVSSTLSTAASEFSARDKFIWSLPTSNAPSNEIVCAFSSTSTSSFMDFTTTLTNYTLNDWIVCSRVGTTIRWSHESATTGTQVLYTGATARPDTLMPIITQFNTDLVLGDSEVTFVETRCLVDIGDPVAQTGRFDPKFRKLVTFPDFRPQNTVTIDGVQAVINYHNTQPPAPGEVNVLPYSGRLWCNPADVGKTISASFIYVQDIN